MIRENGHVLIRLCPRCRFWDIWRRDDEPAPAMCRDCAREAAK
jgi:hypothetical protein